MLSRRAFVKAAAAVAAVITAPFTALARKPATVDFKSYETVEPLMPSRKLKQIASYQKLRGSTPWVLKTNGVPPLLGGVARVWRPDGTEQELVHTISAVWREAYLWEAEISCFCRDSVTGEIKTNLRGDAASWPQRGLLEIDSFDFDLEPYHRMVLTPQCFGFIGRDGAMLRGTPAFAHTDTDDDVRQLAWSIFYMSKDHQTTTLAMLHYQQPELCKRVVKAMDALWRYNDAVAFSNLRNVRLEDFE